MADLYRTLSSDLLVDAPILALRRDRISTATGEATREVVEHFGAAAVAAVRGGGENREVLLIRQYRRPVRTPKHPYSQRPASAWPLEV